MANLASLAAIGHDRVWQTNPVHCIDQLLAESGRSDATSLALPAWLRAALSSLTEEGVQLPGHALRRWAETDQRVHEFISLIETEEPTPRVVGIAVPPNGEDGYVLPLRPVPLTPPSQWRIDSRGYWYHVLNRGNGHDTVFHKPQDHQAFVGPITETRLRHPIRLLAYDVMSNHFRLALWPVDVGDLSRWMHCVLTNHVRIRVSRCSG